VGRLRSNGNRPTANSTRSRESAMLGPRAFAAISAVEGLKLTPAGRMRVQAKKPIEERRADVIRAYTDSKGPT
jgi:hypothetical protein